MPNPLFDAMNQGQMTQPGAAPQQAPQINIGQLMQNPDQIMSLLASKNPQMYNLIKSGGSPELLVRQICQQRGIDVNQFMSQLFR